jgi:predicted RND superfamily exporter protein
MSSPPIPILRSPWLPALVALALVVAVPLLVDLSPRVEGDFFFSTDDPELAQSAALAERFGSAPQILVAAAPAEPDDPDRGLRSAAYTEAIRKLTEELAALPGITGVRSLTSGPPSPEAVWQSPLWGRLLLPETRDSTYLLATGTAETGEGGEATRELVAGLEEVFERTEAATAATAATDATDANAAGVELELHASGVPWVMELIRRHLVRDLVLFSAVGLALFTLLVALLYRSLWVTAGVLVSSLSAAALTLLLLGALDVPVGVLTANIATIVFVLTLSHLVYLTANYQATGRVAEAVALTFQPSLWSMATTVLGFASLWLADARPMRELGTAGALGSLVAFAVAYLLYPPFLGRVRPAAGGQKESTRTSPFSARRLTAATVALLVVVLAAAPGIARVETDPPLTAYFDPDDEIHAGLEAIDRGSGSSPLTLLVRDAASPDGQESARFDDPTVFQRLTTAVEEIDDDPATGAVLALPVLVDEARRIQPMAAFLGLPGLFDVLESDAVGRVGKAFLADGRTETLLLIRMRESERHAGAASRREVLERLRGDLEAQGLEVALTGGLYPLQSALGELTARSLVTGLLGLGLLFALVALAVSRSVGVSVAMLGCLAATPVAIFGVLGWLRAPVDLIASPAANVAVAMGIDSMIHLVTAARRNRRDGLGPWAAWVAARERLWRPIVGAAALLSAGFGIFVLSSFPPTQRFGLAVVLGLAVATAATLVALPRLAVWRTPKD